MIIIILIGLIGFLNITYHIQLWFGNWLFKYHKKSFLRKIWWSEFDIYRKKDEPNYYDLL